MNKQQLITLAKRQIDKYRIAALEKYEQTVATLRTYDDYRICERNLKAAQVQATLYGKEEAKAQVERYTNQQIALLAKYGYTTADLYPKYNCGKCQDSGYVDGTMCSCLQSEFRKLLIAESNVANKDFTFEKSTETNKHNLAVYKKAKQVCTDGNLKNILLTGGTGTGKTYLLTACVNLCATLGKSVLFATAYNLNSLFLECHLGDPATKRAVMENLTDTDLLVIDDLGTETVYKNVTAEYLFALLNERLTAGKQTFISTNLDLQDIRERYDERIFSRLVDQNVTFVAKLEGSDKRISK